MLKRTANYYLFIIMLFSSIRLYSQAVVVNGYYNAADPRDEWTELLVITDNTDLRNWTLRDNNSSQTAWQTEITFTNIAFWNNMRAGTVIMVHHRNISVGGTTYPTDNDKADGYIELGAQNTTYFTGGTFGTSPTFAGNSLNIAGGGEIIQVRNSSGTHVHALGHLSTAGADWTALPTPKLNHAATASSGDAIYVCPGANISDYNGPATGNAFTARNNSTTTFGLPNTCGASASGNTDFWNSLREPTISAQSITPSISTPGDITFSWTVATDPNPSDNTTGYIILRNTSNSFTAPSDGTSYTVGATIGAATVIAELNSSGTTSYTDNSVVAGNCYYYRVYAFRYSDDDINGNSFHQSRGRAYNQTNFVFVDCLAPLPIELLSFTAHLNNNSVELNWITASEQNNDYFTIERSSDGYAFRSILEVDGAGNSTDILNYISYDYQPLLNTSYYRLKQTDFDGNYSYSTIIPVNNIKKDIQVENIYPNPCQTDLNILFNTLPTNTTISIYNALGECILNEKHNSTSVKINTSNFANGVYFISIQNEELFFQEKFIKQ